MTGENGILTLDEIRSLVLPIISRYQARQAVLFGSYARGTATCQSDLDIVVYGGEGFKRRAVFAIAEDLFEASGKHVDVFEINEIKPSSPLKSTIEREGVVL